MELQIDDNFYEVLDMSAKVVTKSKWGAHDSLVDLTKGDTMAKCNDESDYRGVVSQVSHSSGKYGVRIRIKNTQPGAGYGGISRQVANNPNYWTVDSFNTYQLGGATDSMGLGTDGNGSANSSPLYGLPAGAEIGLRLNLSTGKGWVVGSAGDPEADTDPDFTFYPNVEYSVAADLAFGASAEFWPEAEGTFAGW